VPSLSRVRHLLTEIEHDPATIIPPAHSDAQLQHDSSPETSFFARLAKIRRTSCATGWHSTVRPPGVRRFFPVITGQTGRYPIFQGAADFDLELIESRTLDGNIQELIYRPTLHV